MKNWKCIVGATLLTPVCAVVLGGVLVGYVWLLKNAATMQYTMCVVGGLFCLGLMAAIWLALFNHCKKWQKRR